MLLGAIQKWSTPKAQVGSMLPSPVSHQILLACENDRKGTLYVQVMLNKFKGTFNVDRLQEAYQSMVDRHDCLRTDYHSVEGELVAEVHPAGTVKATLQVIEMSECNADDPKVVEKLKELGNLPIDYHKAPLAHLAIVCLADNTYYLQLRYNHSIMDGTSHPAWLKDLAAFYNRKSLGAVQQYSQFSAWQRKFLAQGSPKVETQLKFWKEELRGAPELLELPTDYPRPPVCGFQGSVYGAFVNAETYQKINKFMAENRQSPWRVMLSAYVLLLQQYSQQDEVVISMPRSTRLPTMLNVLGHFANFLPLRLALEDSMSLLDACKSIGATMKQAVANGDVTFNSIAAVCSPKRTQAYTPLAQVSISVLNKGKKTKAKRLINCSNNILRLGRLSFVVFGAIFVGRIKMNQ